MAVGTIVTKQAWRFSRTKGCLIKTKKLCVFVNKASSFAFGSTFFCIYSNRNSYFACHREIFLVWLEAISVLLWFMKEVLSRISYSPMGNTVALKWLVKRFLNTWRGSIVWNRQYTLQMQIVSIISIVLQYVGNLLSTTTAKLVVECYGKWRQHPYAVCIDSVSEERLNKVLVLPDYLCE